MHFLLYKYNQHISPCLHYETKDSLMALDAAIPSDYFCLPLYPYALSLNSLCKYHQLTMKKYTNAYPTPHMFLR